MTTLNRKSPLVLLGLACLIYDSSALATQWVLRRTYEEKRVEGTCVRTYIDLDSIRQENGLIRFWEKSEFFHCKGVDIIVAETDAGSTTSFAVSCSQRKMAITTNRSYAFGLLARDENVPREKWNFFEVAPESVGSNTVDFVCNYVAKQKSGAENSKPDRTAPRQTPAKTDRASKKSDRTVLAGSGSGVVVTSDGHVLTNNHVVQSCASIKIKDALKREHEATVIATDRKNDLSLLKSNTQFSSVGAFRAGTSVAPGESVIALGFPLSGLLASEVNVSPGYVSASAGIGDDTSKLQISAPVQPGNSGGPLLDQYGSVVGIVVQKLDAIKIAKITGDVPQNVNFAVKGEIAQIFLNSHQVHLTTNSSAKKLEPPEIAARGRAFTVLVQCWK